jgi:hypothetical protein
MIFRHAGSRYRLCARAVAALAFAPIVGGFGLSHAATLCFVGNPGYSCTPVVVAASSTFVNGISSSGQMTGFVESPGVQSFTATSPTSATLLPGLTGSAATYAYGINDAGVVAGSYLNSSGAHAFIESGGTYTSFDAPFAGASATFAQSINAAGSVAGFYTDASGNSSVGYIRSAAGAFSSFQVAPGLATYAYHIDSAGNIVGSYVDGAGNAAGFLKNGASYSTYSVPVAAQATLLRGANNFGDLVGNYIDAFGNSVGFVQLGSAFWSLSFPGSTQVVAMGINDQRQVVGYYLNGSTYEVFLAVPVPVPVPASLALFLAGLLQLFARRFFASSLPGKSDLASSALRKCSFADATSPVSRSATPR